MSAIPAARAWLKKHLKASTELIGVQVAYGWPPDFEYECVIVNGPDPTDTEWAAIGQLGRDVKFSIPLLIQIRKPGHTSEESDARADSIHDAVQKIIRSGTTMDGLLIQPALLALGSWDNFPGDQGYVTQLELLVRCHSRDA